MEQDLLEQHKEIYLNAVKGLIENNTKALIEDDLIPLFKAPPLETMDLVKQKLISTAKSNSLVIQTDKVDKELTFYRNKIIKKVEELGDYRIAILFKKLDSVSHQGNDFTFKILKKDLINLDKEIKRELKKELEGMEEYFISKAKELFTIDDLEEKIKKELTKYFKTTYPKQILESIDMKILVKDTTLINGIKEQTERFVFTKENSHLFD